METYVAATPPGLESVTARELTHLGIKSRRDGPERLVFEGDRRDLYRANLWLRTAERVGLRLPPFKATSFSDLETAAAKLPWEKALAPGAPVVIRVRTRASKLYHQRAAAERLAKGLNKRLRRDSPLAKEDDRAQVVYASIERDVCTIDLDASGAPLHKRGYRLETGKAPLRETVAAALILESGWDAAAPLFDPFCGAGTIPIEAALIARRAAPGRGRRFAFTDWPSFKTEDWTPLLATASGEGGRPMPKILGADRDAGAIAAATANAERAGLAGAVAFSRAAVSAVEPPTGRGWVVTNPPYGLRVRGGADVRDLYAQLGRVLRARCTGWRAALVCPTLQHARSTGLSFEPGLSTKNGAIDVRFFTL